MKPIIEVHSTREDWLLARHGSIGSSLSPLLLGLGPKSEGMERNGWLYHWMRMNPAARERYADQIAQDEERSRAGAGINFELRTALEPWVAAMMEEQLGIKIIDPGPYCIVRSAEKPYLSASPDGFTVPDHDIAAFTFTPDGTEEGGDLMGATVGDLIDEGYVDAHTEYKTVRWSQAHKWRDGEPDLYATVQLHHLLAFPEFKHWDGGYIGALIGYGDSKEERLAFAVARDDDLIELIQETCERFWGYIERDEEPPMDGYLSTTRALRLMHPGTKPNKTTVTLGSQFIASHLGWQNTQTEIKRLERELERFRQELEAEAATHEAGEIFIPADPESLPGGAKWTRTLISPKDGTCKHCGKVTRKARPYTKFTSTKR